MVAKNCKHLKWIGDVLPTHIPHRYSKQMAEKSTIVPLKLSLLNEAKYEDCVKILDNTESEIRNYFSQGVSFD